MKNLLSSYELKEKLTLLKDSLQSFDYSELNKIIFFNMYSLYLYMLDIPCLNKSYTVKNIMEEIDQYIPFAITDSSLEIFIDAANASSESEMKRLSENFSFRSKLDFMYLVKNTQNNETWEKILKTCENIRSKKEICFI